ncbi:MAG: hypothetical protein AAF745_15640 [Planctomycetota bacterium]
MGPAPFHPFAGGPMFGRLIPAVLVLVAALTSQASAQNVGPPLSVTVPQSPTLSPYLGLLRTDGGVLPNYQLFVRPRIELQQRLRQQAAAINQQRRVLNTLQDQRRGIPSGPPATTGVRAGFLRYSTFYPNLNRR